MLGGQFLAEAGGRDGRERRRLQAGPGEWHLVAWDTLCASGDTVVADNGNVKSVTLVGDVRADGRRQQARADNSRSHRSEHGKPTCIGAATAEGLGS